MRGRLRLVWAACGRFNYCYCYYSHQTKGKPNCLAPKAPLRGLTPSPWLVAVVGLESANPQPLNTSYTGRLPAAKRACRSRSRRSSFVCVRRTARTMSRLTSVADPGRHW
jgi:hypothetical protein